MTRKNESGNDSGPSFTASQLKSIRGALLARREQLVQQQNSQLSALRSADRHHIADLEEMSGDSSDADSLCAIVDLGASNIDQIDSALEKIAAGTYGRCEDCGGAIAPARLEFLPFARLCIDCQRQADVTSSLVDRVE